MFIETFSAQIKNKFIFQLIRRALRSSIKHLRYVAPREHRPIIVHRSGIENYRELLKHISALACIIIFFEDERVEQLCRMTL